MFRPCWRNDTKLPELARGLMRWFRVLWLRYDKLDATARGEVERIVGICC